MTDDLGMKRKISRRDFLQATALTATVPALGGAASAPADYPPLKTGLRGSHEGSFEAAHQLGREGRTDWSEPEDGEEENGRGSRSEADLRGSLNNDSLSEDEIRQIEEDRAKAEAAAELRDEDYQLAYAIDILTGLTALVPQDE